MIKKNYLAALMVLCCVGQAYPYDVDVVKVVAGSSIIGGSGLVISGLVGRVKGDIRYRELLLKKIQLRQWTAKSTIEELLKKNPERRLILEKQIQDYQNYFKKYGIEPLLQQALYQLTPAQFAQRFLDRCKEIEKNIVKGSAKELGKYLIGFSCITAGFFALAATAI